MELCISRLVLGFALAAAAAKHPLRCRSCGAACVCAQATFGVFSLPGLKNLLAVEAQDPILEISAGLLSGLVLKPEGIGVSIVK